MPTNSSRPAYFPNWQFAPNWWREYALITIQRALFYQDETLVARYARWARATYWNVFPAPNGMAQPWAIFQFGDAAHVVFEGTRNYDQHWQNVVGATLRQDPISRFSFHSYFLWCLDQNWPNVLGFLNRNPPRSLVMFSGHSLGGAVALIAHERIAKMGVFDPAGSVSFGAPRCHSRRYFYRRLVNTFRIVYENDPVPDLPPDMGTMFVVSPAHALAAYSRQDFAHNTDAYVMDGNGGVVFRDTYRPNQTLVNTIAALMDGGALSRTFANLHLAGVYAGMLRELVDRRTTFRDLDDLHEINRICSERDVYYPNLPPRPGPDPAPIPPGPPINVFLDDEASFEGGAGEWSIPPEHRGRTVEQRGVAHDLFFFGGDDLTMKKFRSHDRKLLTTLQKTALAILARDTRVGNPKPTRRLSNRVLMFPPNGTPDVKVELQHVLEQAATLLGMDA